MPRESFEIVVADNDSVCGRSAVEKIVAGRARLVTVTERGAGPARNGAVHAARGRILAFTDSDCVPSPTWMEEGTKALCNSDIVGGHVTVLVADVNAMSGAEAFESVFAFNFADYVARKGFSGSGNMFVARSTFDSVGPFHNGVSEDIEWCQRAVKLGYRLGYCALADVGHPARADWSALLRKWEKIHVELFRLACQTRYGRVRWLLRAWLLPISALVHAPRILTADVLPNAQSRVAALATLIRLRLWRFVDGNVLFFRGKRREQAV